MRETGWAATSPQDLTPDHGRQDHTISPSAHILAPLNDGWRALAIEADRGRCQRRVEPRLLLLTELPALQPSARRRRRGHRLPARVS